MSEGERKRIGLFDATMLVMGGVIGVGIFFTPQAVARQVPDPWAYFGAWFLGGVAAVAGAMTFAELSATFPRRGGWFVFLHEAFGPVPAFLFAWIVLFVVSTGASAVVADFSASQFVALAFGPGVDRPALHGAVGVAILVGVTAVALTGVRSAALLQSAVMLLKLGALGAFVVAGLAYAGGAVAPAARAAALDAPPVGVGLVRASLPVLFSYGGWQLLTYIAPDVRDPQRTLPRAILLGVAGVVTVYLAVNLAYVRVLGMEGLATLPNFTAEMARRTLGEAGGVVLVASMAVSSLGICAAILLATPGLYVGMAHEGLFPARFGRLHPRTGAPVDALLLQGVMVLAYFVWGEAEQLTDAVVFAEWIFHALCGLALLVLRARRPELPRPFRSLAYPLFPALYALLATGVVAGSLVQAERGRTALGLGVLAAGLLVYPLWRAWLRRAVR